MEWLKDRSFMLKILAGKILECPQCGKTARTYKRRIHWEMVKFMESLEARGSCASTRDIFPGVAKASTDASYLVHWGLVERPKRGVYQVTPAGRQFLHGVLAVPAYVLMYDNKVMRKSTRLIDVHDARKEKPGEPH